MKALLSAGSNAAVSVVSIALCTVSGTLYAQAWPMKPVRVIVPFAGGGPIDAVARPVMDKVAAGVGQPMVFDSRPGASGTIGSEIVARAPRDGYTLLFTTGSHTSNAVYLRKLPYDPIADFLPVSQVARAFGQVLVVHPALPVRSVKEFIAFAKARKGSLNYASAGIGNATHIAAELFKIGAGVDLVAITYKGGGPALTDVLGGHIEVMFPSVTQALPYIQSGKLRALAVSGARRSPVLPAVPTFQEVGLGPIDFTGWHATWLPAGTPIEIARRLQSEIAKAVVHPDVQAVFAQLGVEAVASTPEEFAEFVKRDLAQNIAIAKKAGLQPE
ncbi:MAG: tripartite tricarboxylate transporter substrate binding protein [Proteobacteria bacterium]|nr:tripartite tricarboxylate transporter substrate binding protein [Burkholderiales bacterium]